MVPPYDRLEKVVQRFKWVCAGPFDCGLEPVVQTIPSRQNEKQRISKWLKLLEQSEIK